MSTSYFANCIGVFQGGGVRAAAFAGAYEAARESGVAFSGLAGTSAGSIAAALMATGAPPSAITKKLMEVNFNRFLERVDRRRAFVGPISLLRLVRVLPSALLHKIATIAIYGGLYSSSEVSRWLEDALRELLRAQGRNIQDSQVRFCHLPIPLTVVATDLTGNSYAVFSKDRTAKMSVAAAVRASCAIPFFFQPVYEDSSIYVDGGVLSNLPSFVFDNLGDEHFGKYSPRVLGFRLASEVIPSQNVKNIFHLGQLIANTVVDGAAQIQQRLQPNSHVITINTGKIRATDFSGVGKKQKKLLFDAGKEAVSNYIKNERNFFYARRLPTTFVGRDQQMLLFVQSLSEAARRFVIVDKDSHWLYLIFPAFLSAARRGVQIDYITTRQQRDHNTERNEAYRQRLLRGLGARISFVDQLPFRGFLVDPELGTAFAALTHTRAPDTSDHVFETEETRTYSRQADPQVFQYLVRDLTIPVDMDFSVGSLEFKPCDEKLLFQRLQTVPMYRTANFTIREVRLDDKIQAIQTSVKEFKCLQIDGLMRDFEEKSIEPFAPQLVTLNGGMTTIITPPVLEEHGSLLTLIEGHTRTLHCLRNGKRSIRAVVVKNVTAPLPACPRPLADLTIESRTLSWGTQYEQLNKLVWRPIEQHVHPVEDGE